MTRSGARILSALASNDRAAATLDAVRFAVGGAIAEFRAQLVELEDAGLVVEDHHHRGVLVLTAIGARVADRLGAPS